MDQMNISITDHLAGFVRSKVASGRYNNASEVVRDALRRMEDEDLLAAELTEIPAQELLSKLSPGQIVEIRTKILEGLTDMEHGRYAEHDGEAGIRQLADDVIARGRERFSRSR
jgi:antitoxin ParD1/3/4